MIRFCRPVKVDKFEFLKKQCNYSPGNEFLYWLIQIGQVVLVVGLYTSRVSLAVSWVLGRRKTFLLYTYIYCSYWNPENTPNYVRLRNIG
uniref:Uncharacterized protein MANES_04G108800 n=1 Tax=Rhizophora mucronata TaxID=61149 RepID=A0A2P2MWY7_RHIMU